MKYLITSDDTVYEKIGDGRKPIEVSKLAMEFVRMANNGGEVPIDKILEVLNKYHLLERQPNL